MNIKEKMGSKKFNLALLVMLCSMLVVTGILVIGTYTKMTDTLSGTDTATVAKFEYNIKQTEGTDIALGSTSPSKIDIFGTTQADTGIASDDGKLIAPGVEGHFEFTFTNNSTVPVQSLFDDLNYEEKIGDDASSKPPVPIVFFFNGNYYSSIYDQEIGNGHLGSEFVYYFHEGEIGNETTGIKLSGNMDAFKTALNTYSSMTTNSNGTSGSGAVTSLATVFLNNKSPQNQEFVRISWFWPYEAQLKDGDNLEVGELSGSGHRVYLFDKYNMNFSAGDVSAMMTPVLRTIQMDSYIAPTPAQSGTSVWRGGEGNWGLDDTAAFSPN